MRRGRAAACPAARARRPPPGAWARRPSLCAWHAYSAGPATSSASPCALRARLACSAKSRQPPSTRHGHQMRPARRARAPPRTPRATATRRLAAVRSLPPGGCRRAARRRHVRHRRARRCGRRPRAGDGACRARRARAVRAAAYPCRRIAECGRHGWRRLRDGRQAPASAAAPPAANGGRRGGGRGSDGAGRCERRCGGCRRSAYGVRPPPTARRAQRPSAARAPVRAAPVYDFVARRMLAAWRAVALGDQGGGGCAGSDASDPAVVEAA